MTYGVEVPRRTSRRQFLARCGVLGAASVAAQLPAVRAALGAEGATPGASALHLLSRETLSGLVAFAVPGNDMFSKVQGLTSATPGGIDARAPEAMLVALDFVLPFPDTVTQALAAGFAAGTTDMQFPGLSARSAEVQAGAIDRELQAVLGNDETVPLSLLVALMLNFVATGVNPAAVSGPFAAAPFANLSFAEKGEALRRIEEEDAEFVALVDRDVPEPMRESVSGQARFLGGVLTAFAVLASYGEFAVFDRRTGTARARPLGWDLSNYAPGRTAPPDGWDELLGYYRGRRQAQPTRGSTMRLGERE